VATLTYVYADQTAVLGPLATYAEPHTYDLCSPHAQRLTAPVGWEVVRLATDFAEPAPSRDDLLALADAVREAGRPRSARAARAAQGGQASGTAQTAQSSQAANQARLPDGGMLEVGRRGHLRVLRDR